MKNRFAKFFLFSFLIAAAQVSAYQTVQSTGVAEPCLVEKTPFIEYHNRFVVFSPLHQCYERIKPDGIYAGLEWMQEWSVGDHYNYLAVAEFRLGYNFFFNDRDHWSPYAGIGYFQAYPSQTHHTAYENGVKIEEYLIVHPRSPGILYGAIGFLYDHEFTTVFNLGLNVKAAIGDQAGGHKEREWGSPVAGFDVGLPITFRFGPKRHWDLRLEPFNTYWHGPRHAQNYTGSRCTIGYRF